MIKLLKNLTARDWFLASISFVLIVVQVWLDLKMPDYMSEITVLVQTEGSEMKDILLNGGGMLLCAFGSLISAVIVGYLISIIAADFSKKVRKKLFTKVQKLGLGEVKNFQTSSLITRTTNDITQVEMLIAMGLQLLVKAPITAVWAITKILNKSWEWSALTGIAVLILLTTIGIIVIIVMPRFKIVQKLTDKRNKAIDNFLKEFTEEQFKQICQIANNSNFLKGENERKWKADFDFLMRIDKATNVLEGKYNNGKPQSAEEEFLNDQSWIYGRNTYSTR